MLQSFAQSQDWCPSDLLDEDFYQSLMNLQALPTPPHSPPLMDGMCSNKPLSKEDQLSLVSNLLLEDHDLQNACNYDLFHSSQAEKEADLIQPWSPLEEMWQCLTGEKDGSIFDPSPLLSDINTNIFEEIAGSTLDCQQLMGTQESSEATSDYGSTGGELSSSSDSGELMCDPSFHGH